MSRQSFKIAVSTSSGKVSAKYMVPEKPTCIFTLAHGAGASMDHVFMETLADSLFKVGIATLRFNFPFAEQKKFRPILRQSLIQPSKRPLRRHVN
jgi:hypothetical protein